jgi:hypothetical protein
MNRGRDQEGAVGLTTVLATTVALTVTGVLLAGAGDLAFTAARARAAADAAALAAMGTSPLVGASRQQPAAAPAAARQVAAANGASVKGLDDTGWPLRYRVTVAVQPRTGLVARLVGPVDAIAVAGVRPRTP